MTPPPAPNAKPSIADQLTDVLLKVIKPGGVTAGGAGAVWFLVYQSDIPKAIASSIIGVVLSYGATLLEPIHKGNQTRLGKAGKELDKALDKVTDRAIATASRFEDKYLLCQASDCQRVRPDGIAQYDGIFTPLLKEVFVPLGLDASTNVAGFRSLTANDLTEGRLNIWSVLAKAQRESTFRQLVILAWGGSGKTTLLKHIAYLYGTKQQPRAVPKLIPVLLVLRKYRELLSQDTPPDLPELIATQHIPSLPGADELQVPTSWANDILRRGQAIVMIDGFDEVAKTQRPAVTRWINQQIRRYEKSVFIVTSRPKAYREQDAAERLELATPLWVKDFNANQRQHFVEQWYFCQERYAAGGDETPEVRRDAQQAANDLLTQIETRDELRALAKNPLLLNMIVSFHRRFPGADLPKRRVDLYQDICQLQLRDRPRTRNLDTVLTQCNAQTILQRVALGMMQKRWERIQQRVLLVALTNFLRQQREDISATDFLDQVVQISELMIQQEDEYEFAHLSFQEYLAATQIAQQNQETVLYEHVDDDWWKPTILLYASQTKRPTTIIREAMSQGATDLAYACLQETTRQIDPDLLSELNALQQAVTTSRYQALETYLKNGQWRDADEETYRLMITTVGKEEGQWFDKEDLINFPCEDLKAIDGLWKTHSGGQFGFSVQKEIWVEVGGKLDFSKDEEAAIEAFEKMSNIIGWRKDSQYINYRDVTFDTSAPKGHLPFLLFRLGGEYIGEFRLLRYSFLESRLVKCKL